jgi:hypothetical protein
VVVGLAVPLEMRGPEVPAIELAAADIFEADLTEIQKALQRESADLCPDTMDTELPLFWAVN